MNVSLNSSNRVIYTMKSTVAFIGCMCVHVDVGLNITGSLMHLHLTQPVTFFE